MFADELKPNALKIKRLPEILPPNYVLIKVRLEHEQVTDTGIIIGAAPTFTGKDSHGNTYHPSAHLPRRGIVVMNPHELIFNKSYHNTIDEICTIRWDTDIETKEGDEVIFSYLSGMSSAMLLYEGDLYYVLKYDSIYAIDRDNHPYFINGYLGFIDVFEHNDTSLHIEPKKIQNKGICKGISVPNRDYLVSFVDDNITIDIDDECIFNPRASASRIYIESPIYQKFIEKYFVYQKKDVLFVKK